MAGESEILDSCEPNLENEGWSSLLQRIANAEVRAETAEREAEALRFALESLPLVAWTADATGRLTDFTERWLQLTGLQREEALTVGWVEAPHPEDLPRMLDAWTRALASGETMDVEHRIKVADGTYRWMHTRSVPKKDGAGTVVGWYGATDDVHDLKEAEFNLRESEERFRALADNIDQLAWIADESGWIFWYNRRWHEYTGTTPEQMEGWGWQTVHDPDCLPDVMRRWKETIASGEPFDMEFPLRAADGSFRPFLTRVHPIKDDDGNVIRWFGSNTDIGEQKAMEAKLELKVRERTAELEAANQELEGFNYTIAHDLRAPLRAILSSARIVATEAGDLLPEEHLALLIRQVENAKHLSQLIDDLLMYSRLSRAPVLREYVDVTTLARNTADVVHQERGNEIVVEDGLNAEADRALLGLVLYNLIDNAAKFSPAGEPVEVGATETEFGVAFFVRDHGVGFSMEHAKKLFQPFERLVRHNEFPGTGIGLANVRRIVERHGGKVWVQSHPGQGTTFWFTLLTPEFGPKP